MMQLPLIIYDTETASLTKGVVEFAAILLHEGETYTSRFVGHPGCPIDPSASAIHGYYDDDVRDLEPMEIQLKRWWADVKDLVGNVDIVMGGHNAPFDYRQTHPYIPIPNKLQICTLKASRATFPDAPNHKLETMIKYLGLDANREFHSALDDVRATVDLLQYISNHTGKGYVQIAQEQSVPKRLPKMPFGMHKGAKFAELPGDYLDYMLNLPDLDRDVEFSMRSEQTRRAYG